MTRTDFRVRLAQSALTVTLAFLLNEVLLACWLVLMILLSGKKQLVQGIPVSTSKSAAPFLVSAIGDRQ